MTPILVTLSNLLKSKYDIAAEPLSELAFYYCYATKEHAYQRPLIQMVDDLGFKPANSNSIHLNFYRYFTDYALAVSDGYEPFSYGIESPSGLIAKAFDKSPIIKLCTHTLSELNIPFRKSYSGGYCWIIFEHSKAAIAAQHLVGSGTVKSEIYNDNTGYKFTYLNVTPTTDYIEQFDRHQLFDLRCNILNKQSNVQAAFVL